MSPAPCWRRDERRVVTPQRKARLRLVGDEVYPDWEAIYRDNVGRVYRLLYAKVGNAPDAEDLTTEVFLAALGPLRGEASVGEVRAYLLAAARTALASHWRRTLGRQITTLDEQRARPRCPGPRRSWPSFPSSTNASCGCASSSPARSGRPPRNWA
jgi:hypothetical protein